MLGRTDEEGREKTSAPIEHKMMDKMRTVFKLRTRETPTAINKEEQVKQSIKQVKKRWNGPNFMKGSFPTDMLPKPLV